MMYDELLARSFSKSDKKKLGFWAVLLSCFVIGFTTCAVFNSFLGPLPVVNLDLTRGGMMITNLDQLLSIMKQPASSDSDKFRVSSNTIDDDGGGGKPKHPDDDEGTVIVVQNTNKLHVGENPKLLHPKPKEMNTTTSSLPSILCNLSSRKSDFCNITTPVQIHGRSSTIYIQTPSNQSHHLFTLKPYARKEDADALSSVTQFTILSSSSPPSPCTVNHTVPAILFSTGGYIGNHFHEFTDILVPLYITSRHYHAHVRFLITNHRSWWVRKFRPLIGALSRHEVIDIDRVGNDVVHCFPEMMVGLEGHKEFGIDPAKSLNNNYSMRTFAEFVRTNYRLPRHNLMTRRNPPRLLILSRKKSRTILNEKQVAGLARKLGFEVHVSPATSHLWSFATQVNSHDVYVGVHGAGLTNMVFLPQGAVVVQIVPLGLEWLSKHDFELPAKEMGLNYLGYRVSGSESTVNKEFWGIGDKMLREHGWIGFKKIYLDNQNVKLDLERFRETLIKARQMIIKSERQD